MNHDEILNLLNALKIDYVSENEVALLNSLHDQLNQAQFANYTREELSTLLKSEDDVLTEFDIEQDSAFFEEIRNLQDCIIIFFGV
jgi:hypothetical protein